MVDAYYDRPDELARFYAGRIAAGFGPSAERKLEWSIRDARAAGDRRRAALWEAVRRHAREHAAERGG